MKFPIYLQLDKMDCGPTCIRMIAKYYGKTFSLDYLRNLAHLTRDGVSMLGISEAAEAIGLRTFAAELSYERLFTEVPLPCILHWNQNHFVVLPPQKHKVNDRKSKISVADPAHGIIKIDLDTFLGSWVSKPGQRGTMLMLEPTSTFHETPDEQLAPRGMGFLFQYFRPYRRYLLQLLVGMLLGSLLSLTFPFLTQSLVDYGVNHQNTSYVTLVLVSQLLLFLGLTAIDILRNWVLLHINSRINIAIISDFLIKLMKLPMRFFDTKMVGDIVQRIQDHERIKQLMTTSTFSTLFSLVSLFVFSIVLGIYSFAILSIFVVGSLLSVGWIVLFQKKRKVLDYKKFQQLSSNQSTVFELITGMQEIKLNNCETQKRWDWERAQAKLLRLNIKGLALEQYQRSGYLFFNQLKNIFISYVSAHEVINGNMTLGMMLSVSYIIGQMNSPIDQLLVFIRTAQDAKISLERLSEVHNMQNEEQELLPDDHLHSQLREHDSDEGSIALQNVSFQYEGPNSPRVLKDINLTIPKGSVTAIVGSSGSGKTTLLKLLLQFYEPSSGRIMVGKENLATISPRRWRSHCGVVMQDGMIFSDTIARNIAVSDENIKEKTLLNASRIANISDFIKRLPLGYTTKVGSTGNGISTGQKQRLLIARAVYKNPQYLFFDEATSALDANNEKIIIENLNTFFSGKTVVIIAHRLSTVKNADQIVVLEQGTIVETGDHNSLTQKRGRYFELVKNQLELGD